MKLSILPKIIIGLFLCSIGLISFEQTTNFEQISPADLWFNRAQTSIQADTALFFYKKAQQAYEQEADYDKAKKSYQARVNLQWQNLKKPTNKIKFWTQESTYIKALLMEYPNLLYWFYEGQKQVFEILDQKDSIDFTKTLPKNANLLPQKQTFR